MNIAIGADHAGFGLKPEIAANLREAGHTVVDEGTNNTESTDYAATVGRAVVGGSADRGILVCDTGVGMAVAANKMNGLRAAVVGNPGALVLGAKYTNAHTTNQFVRLFLETPFESGGRHERRLNKIKATGTGVKR